MSLVCGQPSNMSIQNCEYNPSTGEATCFSGWTMVWGEGRWLRVTFICTCVDYDNTLSHRLFCPTIYNMKKLKMNDREGYFGIVLKCGHP